MSDWLVTVVRRKDAEDRIGDLGMTCYRPVYRERVVQRGRYVYVGQYLLGAYLLVELTGAWVDMFHRIIRVPSIRGILTCDEKPLVARENEVERLRRMTVNGYVPAPERFRFRRGQEVVVTNGPFAWLEGKFKRSKGAVDVVEFDIFGSLREITLPAGCLEAA